MTKKNQDVTFNTGKSFIEHMTSNLPKAELNKEDVLLEEHLTTLKTGIKPAKEAEETTVSEQPAESKAVEPAGKVVIEEASGNEKVEIDGVEYELPKAVVEKMNNLKKMQASATKKFQEAASLRKTETGDDRVAKLEHEIQKMSMLGEIRAYCSEYDISEDDFVKFCDNNYKDNAGIQDYIVLHKNAVYEGKAKLSKKPEKGRFANLFAPRPDSLSKDGVPVKVSPGKFLEEFYKKR